ncbi:hypothetical protein P3T23_008958 [Paraburkholderia sp. GAS448]|uniref:DUF1254 domain-containing protein n=1 Tax=Paraburkholderia sp. GAS448 TaxID=3035136 RepID=UPI003D22306A
MEIQETTVRTRRRITIPVLVAVVVAVAVLVKLPYLLAFGKGVQAYLYGYPLITMELTKQAMTGPQPALAPGGHRRFGFGPINQFIHATAFPDPAFKDVVAPNADTLYSIAWLDLKAEPMVLSMPEMHGRWVLMEVLDAWTNAYASLGTRQYGGAPRKYLITGPNWTGEVPQGMVWIKSPTNMNWVIGRTYTRNEADFPAVHALQAKYQLTPLSRFLNPSLDVATPAYSGAAVDTATPIVTQIARLDAQAYFSRMAISMADNPPSAEDAPMMKTLRHLWIEPGKPLAPDQLDAATRHGLEDAVWFVRGLFEARSPGTQGAANTNALERTMFKLANGAIDKAELNDHKGWLVPLNLGRYRTHYALRALVSLVGFGANAAEDAVYPLTVVDSNGDQLVGSNGYVLHFERGQIPPAGAFWSLTLYDEKGFFVENPIGRYVIGDRHDLHFNPDGSLDLWIQHAQPGGDKARNWLPAPSGRFKLILRVYDPKPEVLDGRWVPPAVQKIF